MIQGRQLVIYIFYSLVIYVFSLLIVIYILSQSLTVIRSRLERI